MAYIKSRKHVISGASAATVAATLALHTPLHAQQVTTSETLPEVKVRSQVAGENDYKANKAASPKFTQLLVNTTQTISVVKEQVFREQAATTLTKALRNVPGVGTFYTGENGRTNTGDSVRIRGFDTSNNIYVDGVRDLRSVSRDVFNTEQVGPG